MKSKKFAFGILTLLALTSCVGKEKVENFYGKTFSTYNGQISFVKKTEDYSCAYFNDAGNKNSFNFDDTKILDNPKIEKISGKNFLVLDGFKKDRFEVKSDELILDTETKIEYKLDKEENFEKETKEILGREYYTKEKDGHIKIVQKTKQYSFVDVKVPDSYFSKEQLDENKQNGIFVISDRYDFPKVYIQDNGVTKFLNANNLDVNRLQFLDDNKQILDTFTNIRYYLDDKSVAENR